MGDSKREIMRRRRFTRASSWGDIRTKRRVRKVQRQNAYTLDRIVGAADRQILLNVPCDEALLQSRGLSGTC